MTKDIFVVGGGTGGHLFPAIAVAEKLKSRGYNMHLITDDRCAGYLKNHQALQAYIINSSRLGTGIFGKISTIYFILLAVIKSFAILRKTKAKLIIGFGGYVAFAPIFCAYILGIPIILHEQNCFLGKVNRWFASKAKKLCLTFEETSNIPNGSNILVTGNPVREEILSWKTKPKKSDAFKILVTGGSQGAAVFSKIIPEALKLVKETMPKLHLEVTQQARPEDLLATRELYTKAEIKSNIAEFFYNMPELLEDTDLVIARSGASTIAELIALSKPAILVPYPFAAERHQHFNAEVIEKNGGGWCIDQNILTPAVLADKITAIINGQNILAKASKNLKKLQKDSANIIADTAEKIMLSIEQKNLSFL